jgi:hypothetical protein
LDGETVVAMQNNPGNLLLGENFAGETGKHYVGKTTGLKYAIFKDKEMGIRALYKDIRTKLKKSKGNVEDAMLRYLGGDNIEDSREERYIKASTHNPDVVGYINRAKEAYEKEGEDGLIKQIIINENKPVREGGTKELYLNDPEALATGKKLAIMDLPSATTFKNALKVYNQGEYPRKTGGRIMNLTKQNYNTQKFI